MEFPDLGKRCTAHACNVFDFLPYTCVNCNKIYCQDHFKLQAHNCPSLQDPSMDVRVPICPICQSPVPVKRGDDPNLRMNDHIQSNCSDLAPKKGNTCRKKGCTTKLLVPMQCPKCTLNFCVKHRLEVDHQCAGKVSAVQKKPLKPQQQNTSSQPSRAEIERQRRERQAAKQEINRLRVKAKQGRITGDEEIQLAKLLSLMQTHGEREGKCLVC